MTEENKKAEAMKRLHNNAVQNLFNGVQTALPGLSFINETLTNVAENIDGMESFDERQILGIAALVKGIEDSITKVINDFTEDCAAMIKLGAEHG